MKIPRTVQFGGASFVIQDLNLIEDAGVFAERDPDRMQMRGFVFAVGVVPHPSREVERAFGTMKKRLPYHVPARRRLNAQQQTENRIAVMRKYRSECFDFMMIHLPCLSHTANQGQSQQHMQISFRTHPQGSSHRPRRFRRGLSSSVPCRSGSAHFRLHRSLRPARSIDCGRP